MGLLIGLLTVLPVSSQWKRYDPLKVSYPIIQNRGFIDEKNHSYSRFPEKAEKIVSKSVWDLSRQTAGLAIYFYSNASRLQIRYTTTGDLNFPHMSSTGVSGIDLYSIDGDGDWHYCYGDYRFKDTVTYSYERFPPNKYHAQGYEYRLYLPLYNEVKWLEIEIPEEADLKFIPKSTEKPIVLYGTSIAQGGCASRPAMAWGTILQRAIDYPLINLGFSGNGKMEKEVLELINEVDARLYILDCLPNLYDRSEKELESLLVTGVKLLRKTHSAPILMLEHAGLSNMNTDTMQYHYVVNVNRNSRKAYERLCTEGIPHIYYLSREELNLPADTWVDAAHPNDFGMEKYAMAVEKKVREILHIPKGTQSTVHPVTQHRCANYDWLNRHYRILEEIRENSPKAVILGNSITHYWGGQSEHHLENGSESWNKEMAPLGFLNLGCAWDRIENVLWRVYHGELDGYEAEKVVLMIGINNVGIDTDEDIVKGIQFLLCAIRQRQPKALIKVVGMLPCRDQELQVRNLNIRICQIAQIDGFIYSDPGKALLLRNGKIDESLFTDGTHPNEEGYKRIVKGIVSFYN